MNLANLGLYDDLGSYSIAPIVRSVPAAASDVVVSVSGTGPTWIASSNVWWARVIAPVFGNGAGQVRIRVAANPGASRTGSVVVAGNKFWIVQAAGVNAEIPPSNPSPVQKIKN